jgi:hypothetical protein
MINCPVDKKHTVKSTDNNDRFDSYYCVKCKHFLYEATTHDNVMQQSPTTLYDNYETIQPFQKNIYDEEALQLMCSEAQRLFNR